MDMPFERLLHDEVFEYGSSGRAVTQMLGSAYAQKMAEQPGVVEVELRSLREPLAKARMVGLEPENDVARLEQGKPGVDRCPRDAHIVREPRYVKKRPAGLGAKAEQCAEGRRAARVDVARHVPFDIGLQIVLEEHRGRDIRDVQARIAALEHEGIGGKSFSMTLALSEGEWQKLADAHASGECLPDLLQQQEVL